MHGRTPSLERAYYPDYLIISMEEKFSFLYHQQSKKLRASIPFDSNEWPEEWHTTYYKTYPRFAKVALEDSAKIKHDLFAALQARRSRRAFSGVALSKTELAILLQQGAGLRQNHAQQDTGRTYPSPGARYPIEIYIATLSPSSDGLPEGLYHYAVKEHSLDVLWGGEEYKKTITTLLSGKWYAGAGAIVFFTGVFERSEHKYKNLAYRFTLLEAGLIMQNFYLVAEAL